MDSAVRLTSLAHGGGCGCKLAPAVLHDLLSSQHVANPYARLLVGIETGDDAAVWQIDDRTCLIATTDFFMPVVDDPHDFGRIAATNAISDVYAMGGTPIFALAILGMPIEKLSADDIRKILDGGRSVCNAAGIPIAGGHSIDSAEPIYGLAVIGTCAPNELKRNSDARPGDAVILTKGLGVGVYSAAFKKDALSADAYAELIATTTLLNKIGSELGKNPAVHAVTDVTGFGLLGHALEVARGSNATIAIDARSVPRLREAEKLAKEGFVTGASARNWQCLGHAIEFGREFPQWLRDLLVDPQTSGGLLITCSAEEAGALLKQTIGAGYAMAQRIGLVESRDAADAPFVKVTL